MFGKANHKNLQVLFAFIASALLTVLAVVFAYFSGSMPDTHLSEKDRHMIEYIIHSLKKTRVLAWTLSVQPYLQLYIPSNPQTGTALNCALHQRKEKRLSQDSFFH